MSLKTTLRLLARALTSGPLTIRPRRATRTKITMPIGPFRLWRSGTSSSVAVGSSGMAAALGAVAVGRRPPPPCSLWNRYSRGRLFDPQPQGASRHPATQWQILEDLDLDGTHHVSGGKGGKPLFALPSKTPSELGNHKNPFTTPSRYPDCAEPERGS